MRKPFFLIFLVFLFFLSFQPYASSEWLYYDEGDAVHASSGLRYQGVRFSLPGDSIRAPLLQLAFFYSTSSAFCPVKIHITDHTHSVRIADRISYDAVNGWNYVDVSIPGISVPHNFYIILENKKCGFLMMDNHDLSERSFKGNYLKSMTTRLSRDLLIRAEIGDPWEIPVMNAWDVSVSEKITIQQKGTATQKIIKDFGEAWTLYAENSFAMDSGIYGLWKQKGGKFSVSLDPEEVRGHLITGLSDDLAAEITDLIVTKISFTGKIAPDGIMTGTLRIFAKVSFFAPVDSAKVTVERKFTGMPVAFSESFSPRP